jgi:hypothetical protein
MLHAAKPIQKGSTYPAQEFCSHCGLCDTYYVAHVKDACAFLGDGEEYPALRGHGGGGGGISGGLVCGSAESFGHCGGGA